MANLPTNLTANYLSSDEQPVEYGGAEAVPSVEQTRMVTVLAVDVPRALCNRPALSIAGPRREVDAAATMDGLDVEQQDSLRQGGALGPATGGDWREGEGGCGVRHNGGWATEDRHHRRRREDGGEDVRGRDVL